MAFDRYGNPIARRTVFSATGRGAAWARGQRIDLTDLRDRLDPGWHLDARGRALYVEFLFVSGVGMPDGEGIHLDNLSLSAGLPTPIIVPPDTPTPPPTVDRTVACTGGRDCGSLSVRAFVDSRCDGRYQAGLDSLIRSHPRVDVVAGAELLGTELGDTGSAFFRLPVNDGAEVRFEVPTGYVMCSNSPNPESLSKRDFGMFRRASVDFRVKLDR
jgi:hypothetical protein